jgi:Uma2 family endonuclease
LGRLPKRHERPSVVVEFVSSRTRDRLRDYTTKRDEYMRAKIKEYWIIDRFERCMVVFSLHAGKVRKHVVRENQVYTTPLLPGFELPLAKLLALADQWADQAEETEQ